MKILIFNQNWFCNAFRECGDEVIHVSMRDDGDYKLSYFMDIADIIKSLPNNFKPDRILFLDNSAPLYMKGLENIDIPMLFYSVDIHQHYTLHKLLNNVFDGMFVAMKDYVPRLNNEGYTNVKWLPLFATKICPLEFEKKYNAVFVGTLNEKLNPDRVKFFRELEKITDIYCTTGKWWEIFPKSHIVMNQTVKGDLNFRVFEAMGSGSLLLTEKSSNGLFDLFKDKVHMITYNKGDIYDAKEKIDYYLSHLKEANEIARAGREEILKNHMPQNRVEVIRKELINLDSKNRNIDNMNFSMAVNYLEIFASTKLHNENFAKYIITLAMQYFNNINYQHLSIGREDIPFILSCAINYDNIFRTNICPNFIRKVKDDVDFEGFKLYDFWNLKNNHDMDIINSIYPDFNNEKIYNLVNNYITSFLL